MKIDFDKGLFGALRKEAGPLWHDYTRHSFISQLAQGTLPSVCFKRFLMQDYLFLMHYARAYALLAAKSLRIEDIREALQGLQAITEEMPLHIRYCAQWGISEAMLHKEEEAAQTIAYTRYVLDVGHTGDRLDLMCALLPCMAGYAEIGLRLAESRETVWENNPYAEWIQSYQSESYLQGVQTSLDMINKLGQKMCTPHRFKSLSHIFNTATRLETDFWQMGLDADSNRTSCLPHN